MLTRASQSVTNAQGNVDKAQDKLNGDQATLANDQKAAGETQDQINDVQGKLNNTDSLSLTSGATFSQSKYENIVNQYNSDHNLTEEDNALNQMMAPGSNDDSTPLEGGSYHQEASLDGQTFNPANQQLTSAQQEALANYVASLINALRAKYNPSAPKVQVSAGMLQRMRTEINQVNADGKTGVMSQTDWNAQQKAFGNMDTEEWLGNVGLEWDGSNWTANHDFTMNQIYQNTFNVLQKYLQRDYQDEGQLGAVGLLGATCYRNEQGTYKMVPNEYLGVDIDNGGGLHIIMVFDNPALPVASDVKADATTPDEFNTTTLQNQLNNLKQTLASQQAKVNQDQKLLTRIRTHYQPLRALCRLPRSS
ncbi:hypothetical protein ACLHIM_07100 [Ligilactobacillus sp. LYQ112]|uniref:hypothetical protein n=1 Tax=Ligilactobacillus sp. LYQ112 TaxID=3391060 RepID=UPI003983C3ED